MNPEEAEKWIVNLIRFNNLTFSRDNIALYCNNNKGGS